MDERDRNDAIGEGKEITFAPTGMRKRPPFAVEADLAEESNLALPRDDDDDEYDDVDAKIDAFLLGSCKRTTDDRNVDETKAAHPGVVDSREKSLTGVGPPSRDMSRTTIAIAPTVTARSSNDVGARNRPRPPSAEEAESTENSDQTFPLDDDFDDDFDAKIDVFLLGRCKQKTDDRNADEMKAASADGRVGSREEQRKDPASKELSRKREKRRKRNDGRRDEATTTTTTTMTSATTKERPELAGGPRRDEPHRRRGSCGGVLFEREEKFRITRRSDRREWPPRTEQQEEEETNDREAPKEPRAEETANGRFAFGGVASTENDFDASVERERDATGPVPAQNAKAIAARTRREEGGDDRDHGLAPRIKVFLPRDYRLNFDPKEDAERRRPGPRMTMTGVPPCSREIKRLLARAKLTPPRECSLERLGSISLHASGRLISCLLFKRDKTSEFVNLFDVVRLATEPDWQRRGYATRCLDVCKFLLRHRDSLRSGRTILRADVLRRGDARAFYGKVGFARGVPRGISKGPYCTGPKRNAYHFEINEPLKTNPAPSPSFKRSTKCSGMASAQPTSSKQGKAPAAMNNGPPKTREVVDAYQRIRLGRTTGFPVVVSQGKSEHHAILIGCDGNPQNFLLDREDGQVDIRWESTLSYTSVPTESVRLKQVAAARPVRNAAERHPSRSSTTAEAKGKCALGSSRKDGVPALGRGEGAITDNQHQRADRGCQIPSRPQAQWNQPQIEVFCSRHSQLEFKDAGVIGRRVPVTESNDREAIEASLGRAALRQFNNKTGWIGLRTRPGKLDSYVLFERDASASMSIRVYDVVRLEDNRQCYADAALCVNAFATLLRRNFPRDRIIVRAAVFKWARSFYEGVGFSKGVPRGISAGPYRYKNCTTFCLLINEIRPKKVAKRRRGAAAVNDAVVNNNVTARGTTERAGVLEGAKPDQFAWEEEYRTLCDYYLASVTREDDELPSGMTLRKKEAPPNLIRYKNSEFRLRLYNKILRLKRLGERRQIHRILKMLCDHDMTCNGAGDDGPKALLDEIFPAGRSGDVMVCKKPSDWLNDATVGQGFVDCCSLSDGSTDENSNQSGLDVFDTSTSKKPDNVISTINDLAYNDGQEAAAIPKHGLLQPALSLQGTTKKLRDIGPGWMVGTNRRKSGEIERCDYFYLPRTSQHFCSLEEIKESTHASPSTTNEETAEVKHNDMCETCGGVGELICCLTCNLVFHLNCIRPKLTELPDDYWSCAFCIASGDARKKPSKKEQHMARLAVTEIEMLKREAREKYPVLLEYEHSHTPREGA